MRAPRAHRRIARLSTIVTIVGAFASLAPAAWGAVPAPVLVTPAEGAVVTEDPRAGGTAAPGVLIVYVYEGGTRIGSDVPDGSGNWSAPLPLGDGQHTIVANAIDGQGDMSPNSPPRTFTVDLAPATPAFTKPSSNQKLNTTSVAVEGTADTDATVTIRENGTVLAEDLPVDAARKWATTLSFTEGSHTITAVATDGRGRDSAPASRSFSVDVTAPAAPLISTPEQNAFVQSATLTGTAEPGVTVSIYEGTTLRGTTNANGSGNWTRNVSASNGAHTYVARATDGAGNASTNSAPRSFTVDSLAPNAAIATANNTAFTPVDEGTITGSATDNIGVASVELRYEIFTGAHVKTVWATCPACPGTSVSWSGVADLNPGYYRVEVTAIDRAGNRSPMVEIAFVRL